ncbi:MAG: hypothetical protein H6Q17_86 [Bacteroidetes bacterium]|nr:hypothetical protein [Bacteroidota bacterium]
MEIYFMSNFGLVLFISLVVKMQKKYRILLHFANKFYIFDSDNLNKTYNTNDTSYLQRHLFCSLTAKSPPALPQRFRELRKLRFNRKMGCTNGEMSDASDQKLSQMENGCFRCKRRFRKPRTVLLHTNKGFAVGEQHV